MSLLFSNRYTCRFEIQRSRSINTEQQQQQQQLKLDSVLQASQVSYARNKRLSGEHL